MNIEMFSPKVGRRKLRPDERNQVSMFKDALRDMLMADVADVVVNSSPGRIRELLKRITTRTETEAARIFNYAVNIISNSKTGAGPGFVEAFSSSDIDSYMGGGSTGALALRNPLMTQAGTVRWENLSESWAKHKYGHARQNANKFFMYEGDLRQLLMENQRIYVKRFGGIKAQAAIAQQKRGPITQRDLHMVVGEITVSIFPNIPITLLPMLGSNRWTASNNGEFERRFFSGRMLEKLIGPEGYHRPLLLPLTQFWVAFRIPRAIQEAVNSWTNSPRGGS